MIPLKQDCVNKVNTAHAFKEGDRALINSFYVGTFINNTWVPDCPPREELVIKSIYLLNDLIIPASQIQTFMPKYCGTAVNSYFPFFIKNQIKMNCPSLSLIEELSFAENLTFRVPETSVEFSIGGYILNNCSGALGYRYCVNKAMGFNIHILNNSTLVGIVLVEELLDWIQKGMPNRPDLRFTHKANNNPDYAMSRKVATFFQNDPKLAKQLVEELTA